MITKLKLTLSVLALTAGLCLSFTVPAAAAAAGGAAGSAKSDVCAGINVAGGACADNGTGLSNVIKVVLQILSAVAGAASVIMVVVGGMRYITSGGDSSKIASAKSTIIYAIVGLIIVGMAQIMVRFVAGKAIKP